MARTEALKQGVDIEAVFQHRLGQSRRDTQALLDRLLASSPTDGERARPARLLEAMRYASLGGGKRLAAFSGRGVCGAFGVSRANSLMAGAALECVHCYSLAHDDLPAMDNDDLRRGRPTTHKAFDEATAVLAGDGLLTLAFDILSAAETLTPTSRCACSWSPRWRAPPGLAAWSAGQMLDLAAEGRFDAAPPRLGEREVRTLQAMKTGALLRFACLAGAILGKANRTQGARSTGTARRWGKRFRSPTISSISKAIRPGRQGNRQGCRRPQGDPGRRARPGGSTAAARGTCCGRPIRARRLRQ